MRQRPGQKNFADPGPDWGTRIIEPGFPSAAGGWWDDYGSIGCCIAAWQPKGAANYASSKIDLTGNGNNATEGVAPGWNAAQGWAFNGLNMWLDTGLVPAADQSWSAIVQYANTLNNGYLLGLFHSPVVSFFLRPNNGGGSLVYANGTNLAVAPQLLAGNLGVAGNQGYRNGAPDGGLIPGWGGAGTRTIAIGANNTAPPSGYFQGFWYAGAIYNCTLTAPQMAAVAAWMAMI